MGIKYSELLDLFLLLDKSETTTKCLWFSDVPFSFQKFEGSNMNIMVRRANPEDTKDVHNVIKHAFEDYRRIGYREAAIQSAIISKSEIQRRINEELMLVAEMDKQIVGTVTGTIEYETMHVKTLATHPSFQNLGIGTRLMQEIEREAREDGCYKISLFTTPVMKSAIHMYKKCGYEKEGILKKQFHGIDLIAFGKILRK